MTLTAIVFSCVLAASFLVGAAASRFVRNVSDYYVAGGRMPWYALTGTFLASNVSAGLFLGATNMAGHHGYAIWSAFVPTSIGFVLAIAGVGVIVRRLSARHEIYDFADILATRYSAHKGAIRALSASLLPVVYVPVLAAQLIALATIAATLFGLPYGTVLLAIVAIVVSYTLLGGMLGVVWSDTMQLLVLLFGLVLAVPVGMGALGEGHDAGAWERIVNLPKELFESTSTGWPWFLAVGQMVWLFAIPVQPHLVTRFLTARDERTILIALPVCLTAGLAIYASSILVGLLGRLAQPDLPAGGYYYIELATVHLGPWIGAFALAGIAAAALSTCSTVLIVSGQSFSRELCEHWLFRNASQAQSLRLARYSVLLVGAVGWLIAWFQPLGIFWLVVLSASLLASVYFVPLVWGFLHPGASAKGAIAAMLAGGLTSVTVFTVNELLDTHYFVSEAFAGILASALAMWRVSKRFPSTPTEREVQRQCLQPLPPSAETQA